MRLTLSIGAAFAALTVAATAQTEHTERVVVRHGPALEIDANDDGWITRAEASAGFDRVFEQMDSNDDSRLDGEDRPAMETFNIRIDEPDVHVIEGEGGNRRIIVRRAGEGGDIEQEIERAERDVRRAENDADTEREVHRDVVIIRGGPGVAPVLPVPPVPPVPPAPPMFMMLIANSDEADLNGDGALSRDEFRNQHLRFFDASDANGDGRVRFEPPVPPEPPQPPEAPTPPTPPRHR